MMQNRNRKLHTDYDAFKKQLDKATPKYLDVPGLFDEISLEGEWCLIADAVFLRINLSTYLSTPIVAAAKTGKFGENRHM